MVHALRETHRVLKPDGLLIDLRPASARRHVGITCEGRFQPIGIVRRNVEDVRAANRANARVVRAGLFKIERRVRFEYKRHMDTLDEFQSWWDEFAHAPLNKGVIEKIARAFAASCQRRKILVRILLAMQVLKK